MATAAGRQHRVEMFAETFPSASWFPYLASSAIVVLLAVVLDELGLAGRQVAVAIPVSFLVFLIAYAWGLGPAVVAVVPGALALNYFVMPPLGFSLPTVDEGTFYLALIAVACVVGFVTDRTRTARAEARESAASERFQRTLLNCVSHDLRTPLTAVMGSLSTLLVDGRRLDEDARHELVKIAYARIRSLDRSIGELLAIARLEGGAVRLRREPRHLWEIIRIAFDRLGDDVAEGPYQVSLPDDLPKVPIDGPLLSHALANVFDNAAKYSPPGAPIEVKACVDCKRIILSVADRGKGIPVEQLDRVFEKFYRFKQPAVARGAAAGTGLGLAISKSIVGAHGGRIWAEQRRGGGTVVTLSLPLE
jgi:two-component system, OmpR family, sensor histidine kinase KdpD